MSPYAFVVFKSKNINDMGPYCFNYYKPNILVNTYDILIILKPDMKDWHMPKYVDEEEVLHQNIEDHLKG